ncbi:MAG: hypothetical protein MUE54_13810 [Anaerolineae bacterium]|nr:hypothetical protein [Anaerolineae bacterium]
MDDAVNFLFYINIAWLIAHEMDAILCYEWRIFFFLKPFDDVTAYRIFTGLHIPLLALIIWFAPNKTFQIGFDLFLIIHVGLHWIFRNNPNYKFNTWFSNLLIVGAGVLGAIHLILILL